MSDSNLVFRYLRKMDAFPKIDAPYLKQTSCGGIASLVTYLLMGVLMTAEVVRWVFPPISVRLSIDRTVHQKIPLSFDISIATDCNKVAAVLFDDGGHADLLNSQIQSRPIDFRNVVRSSSWKAGVGEESSAGCRVSGRVEIHKVNGRFLLMPLPSIMMGALGTLLTSMDRSINFSHVVHHLSFGEHCGAMENPLDGQRQMAMKAHENFSYFLSILPTRYQRGGSWVETNQYSVIGYLGVHDERRVDKPGLYFKYDFEPLSVELAGDRRPFAEFVVHMVGILGGVYTSTGLIAGVVNVVSGWLSCLFPRKKSVESGLLLDEKSAIV